MSAKHHSEVNEYGRVSVQSDAFTDK